MSPTTVELGPLLLAVADIWDGHIPELSDIDSRFGDGDHGIAMGKIAQAFRAAATQSGAQSPKATLEALSSKIINLGSGSASLLYGTLVGGFAEALPVTAQALSADLLKKMFSSGVEAMQAITRAREGDKTLMDALLPAAAAAVATVGDASDVLTAASRGAAGGAQSTAEMVSAFGRARSYGKQTLGTIDAGARSMSLLFQGLMRGCEAATRSATQDSQ